MYGARFIMTLITIATLTSSELLHRDFVARINAFTALHVDIGANTRWCQGSHVAVTHSMGGFLSRTGSTFILAA